MTVPFGLVLTILTVPAARGQEPRELEKKFGAPALGVRKPAAPPEIDGKLDDAAWKDASPVTLGFCSGAWWDSPSQKTEARVLADEKAVYFGVRCFESEPARLVREGKLQKGVVLNADTVEFFLDPGHREKRFDYHHVIVTAGGAVYHGKGLEAREGNFSGAARVRTVDREWTAEVKVPFEAMGLVGGIPKVWGLNVCRQRPELGCEMPKAAKALAVPERLKKALFKLDAPQDYRPAEYSSWSPTMADFCGWPFYGDSRPFHFSERFGHALLETGTVDVAPPGKLFETLLKADFEDGQVGPFRNAVIGGESFRGAGRCLELAPGQKSIALSRALENLDDVTLLMAFKIPAVSDRKKLNLSGRAPDGRPCGPERYELFLPREEAQPRDQFLEQLHQARDGAGPFELYDTHADMVRWKPCGRVRKGPGPWAMVEGYFAEPSACQVRWPGGDWAILRIRPGAFRRTPGRPEGQRLVSRNQEYPEGLSIAPQPADGFRLDEVVIFRGSDVEPPERVKGVKVKRQADLVEVSWDRSKDNTLTAFYRIYAGTHVVAESHRLAVRLIAADLPPEASVKVSACDLYGNESEPATEVP